MTHYKHITEQAGTHTVDLRLEFKEEQVVDSQNSTPSSLVYRTAYDLVNVEIISNPTDTPDSVLDDLLTTPYTWEDY